MRVLHLLPNAGSGIEILVFSLLPFLRQNGVDNHLVFLGDTVQPLDIRTGDVGSVTIMNIRRSPLRTVIGYRRMLRRLQPDIVHSHSMLPSILAIAGGNNRVRHLRTIHAPYPYFSASDPRSTIKRRLEGWALSTTRSALVCVSDGVAHSLPWTFSNHPALTIYNGVNTARIPMMQRRPSDHRILAVGRLEDQKAYPRLLEAFASVLSEFPTAQLIIAGEGSRRDLLERMIETLQLGGNVTLLGHVADAAALYCEASLYVCSSDYEGLSLSVMEALCAGCTVVSTPIDAVKEIDAIVGGTIRFAADFSPTSLAQTLQKELQLSRPSIENIGPNTIDVRMKLSADNCAKLYLDLYRGKRPEGG